MIARFPATLEGTPRTCTEDLSPVKGHALPESLSTGTDTSKPNRRHQTSTPRRRLLRIDSRKVVRRRPSSVLRPPSLPSSTGHAMSPARSPLQGATVMLNSAEGGAAALKWFLPFPSPGSGGDTARETPCRRHTDVDGRDGWAPPRDGRRWASPHDNSTTPSPHSSTGRPPKRINHHLSCLLGFMCLLLDRSLRKRKRGGVYVPFRSSVAAHVSSFARS